MGARSALPSDHFGVGDDPAQLNYQEAAERPVLPQDVSTIVSRPRAAHLDIEAVCTAKFRPPVFIGAGDSSTSAGGRLRHLRLAD